MVVFFSFGLWANVCCIWLWIRRFQVWILASSLHYFNCRKISIQLTSFGYPNRRWWKCMIVTSYYTIEFMKIIKLQYCHLQLMVKNDNFYTYSTPSYFQKFQYNKLFRWIRYIKYCYTIYHSNIKQNDLSYFLVQHNIRTETQKGLEPSIFWFLLNIRSQMPYPLGHWVHFDTFLQSKIIWTVSFTSKIWADSWERINNTKLVNGWNGGCFFMGLEDNE